MYVFNNSFFSILMFLLERKGIICHKSIVCRKISMVIIRWRLTFFILLDSRLCSCAVTFVLDWATYLHCEIKTSSKCVHPYFLWSHRHVGRLRPVVPFPPRPPESTACPSASASARLVACCLQSSGLASRHHARGASCSTFGPMYAGVYGVKKPYSAGVY